MADRYPESLRESSPLRKLVPSTSTAAAASPPEGGVFVMDSFERRASLEPDWVDALLERLEILTDCSFFREFVEYLTPLGRPKRRIEECISLVWDFSRYIHRERRTKGLVGGREFSLTRLSFLYALDSSEGPLDLPRPWSWLAGLQEKKTRDAAHCAYNDLLDFLEHLLVKNGADHISSEESLRRQQYLQDIEREVLRTHPYKSFAARE